MVYLKRICIISCLLANGVAQAEGNVWVRRPTEKQLQRIPGLRHETFDSPSMMTEVGYSVILPASYDTGDQRYPVVYWLHGGGGNESSCLFTSMAWCELVAAKQAKEVILVYPNGYRSGYMDHSDKQVMTESMIIHELLPRIDARFRTIATRAGRAVHGFSMGASGCLKFVTKYPNLFCSAVAFGGGAVNLQRTQRPFVLNILQRNLASDAGLIQQNNTYHFLEKNQDILRRNDTRILLICGEKDVWLPTARTFHRALNDRKLASRLITVPYVGHDLPGLTASTGRTATMFQDRVFQRQPPFADVPHGRTTSDVYYSLAENRLQRFEVTLPTNYSASHRYPLVVQLFGAKSLRPTSALPFIRVRPQGRGVWGYRSMSRYDVMQVIEHAKLYHRVDPDRVYLTGTSSGATGAVHTAALRPDTFAGLVPLVAFGNDLPLENFRNLPIRCEHGINDWTSAIGNVRVQFQKLKQLQYDAALHEHPSAGHGIRTPPAKTLQWLFRLRRDTDPQQVVYSCEHPRDGKAYWVQIETFADPHAVARIEARVRTNSLDITTTNIHRFALDLTSPALSQVQTLTVDRTPIRLRPSNTRQQLTVVKNERWEQESDYQLPTVRPYGAGAAANLFQGEPLVVVYGTHGDNADDTFLSNTAHQLAHAGGPHFKPANVHFPVVTDEDVSKSPWQHHNLLVVGTPENNSYLRKIADDLPFAIEHHVLFAGARKPLALSGSVLSFHFYNPANPRQLIYVVAPYLSHEERVVFLHNPRAFLAGSDGFKQIDQADVIVRGADMRIRREMQLGSDWELIEPGGTQQSIGESFTSRVQLANVHLRVMRDKSNADVALWWGPEDKGLFGGYDFNWLPTYEPTCYTRADFSVRRREVETMTATLPGTELRDVFRRWIATREIVSFPTLKVATIKPERQYRLVLPMDLIPKLGTRRKLLRDVMPGPNILPAEIAAEIFAAE